MKTKMIAPLLFFTFSAALTATPLTIFYTGDTHGAYETVLDKQSGQYRGGYLMLEEKLALEREAAKHSVYLDSGDQQTGSVFSSLVENGVHGGAVIGVFNRLGLEASVFGNHEFDFSYSNTRDLARSASYPFVCTNLLDKSTRQSVSGKPFTVIEKDGLRIGVFGVTLELLPEKVKAENVSSVRILPPTEAIEMYLDEVDRKSDLIVVLSHQGWEADSLLAESLDDRVDVIIGGHDHIWADEPIVVNGKYLLYSGSHLEFLGRADLDVKDDRVVKFACKLIPLSAEEKPAPTPLAEYIQSKVEKVEQEMSRVLGIIPEDWIPDKYESTALSHWIADALKKEYQGIYHPDLAIINNGGLRKAIPAGPVTLRDMYELLPFNNTVVVFSCYGRDLLRFDELNRRLAVEKPHDICESTAPGYLGETDPNQDTEEPVRYDLGGRLLDPDAVYRVVSHDYIAGQWDKYLGFKPFDVYDTGELILDAMIRQVEAQFRPPETEGHD